MWKPWVAAPVIAATLTLACNRPDAPTAPTTPPALVSLAEPPAISCPGAVTITAPPDDPARVDYPQPSQNGGQTPVTVECSPAATASYPVGETIVECHATDGLKRTASCSFTVTVQPPPRLRRNRILAFGDSVTAGELVVPNTDNLILQADSANAYPAVLAELLFDRYGRQPTVFNAGLGGEKAGYADRRLPFEIGKYSPDVVVLLEGYNDLLYAEPAQGIQAAELGMSVLAAEARNRGARVFICTLSPTKPGRRQIPLATIQSANDRLRAVARGEGAQVIEVFSALIADLNVNVGSDGLHPTPLGYRRIAETVFASLRADLEIH
ncbi:MAG: GDSL-type esterase/lipase family protein [Vicinamibacterales bacterium]